MNKIKEATATAINSSSNLDFCRTQFGKYDKATYGVIKDKLKRQEEPIAWLINAKYSTDVLKKICFEFSCFKEVLQILNPQFKFYLFEVKSLSSSWWRLVPLALRLFSTVLFYISIICKPFIRKHLWIVITAIYIPAMYIFDSISDTFVLINPDDVAHSQRFNFASAIYNCSSAPKGRPLLLTYSYHVVSGWHDVLVYAFTIQDDWLHSAPAGPGAGSNL
jgi:hypothetical protein